jgi:hypothetical protein
MLIDESRPYAANSSKYYVFNDDVKDWLSQATQFRPVWILQATLSCGEESWSRPHLLR